MQNANYAILACIATLQDSMEQKLKEKDYTKKRKEKGRNFNEHQHHFHP